MLKDRNNINRFIKIIALILLFIFTNEVGAAYSPELYNDMPAYLMNFKNTVQEQARKFPETFFLSSSGKDRTVALTFDDGPDSINTPLILDILRKEGVKASFFLIGENVIKYSELTKRITAEGHQIGNHSWSHKDLRELPDEYLFTEEILSCSEEIEGITGIYPRVLRPPYGALNNKTIKFLGDRGWKIVNWSIDSFDWDDSQNNVKKIQEKLDRYIHPGAIILLHCGEGRESTVKALPGIIENLRKKGYQFKRVNDILAL